MINLFKVYMSEEAVQNASEVLKSGKLTQGAQVDAFENKLAAHFDNPNIVTVNSCTSAIHLALDLIKEEVGHCTVLTTPMTCAATNLPILHNGLDIKWYDLEVGLIPSFTEIASKFDANTRILIIVHWGGVPVGHQEIENLKDYYRKKFGKRLFVIEDCAHSWGAFDSGRRVGSFPSETTFSAYSCQAIKTLTTGDGGILITPADFYKKARLKRWFGLDRDNKVDFRSCQDISEAGYKFHMNDVAASIGRANLKAVDWLVKRQNANGDFYNDEFGDAGILPWMNTQPSYWLYTILVDDRPCFIKYMREAGIETNPVHTRNDLFSVFSKYKSSLPSLDSFADNMICIPCGWWVSEEDRSYIAEKIHGY